MLNLLFCYGQVCMCYQHHTPTITIPIPIPVITLSCPTHIHVWITYDRHAQPALLLRTGVLLTPQAIEFFASLSPSQHNHSLTHSLISCHPSPYLPSTPLSILPPPPRPSTHSSPAPAPPSTSPSISLPLSQAIEFFVHSHTLSS